MASVLGELMMILNKINMRCRCSRLLCWLAFSFLAVTLVSCKTDSSDVSGLNVMYTSMNSPSVLDGWTSSGGDPCGESWKGISCSGSKVTEINLSGLGLTGSFGYKLSDLKSVTRFDLSKNSFKGNIPYQLPPNLQLIDLSGNEFDGNVPYSISQMTDLKEMDLNNNKLNGQLSDMFGKLSKLTKMDLSSNSLSGELPQSFKNLSSLTTLRLQDNKFTGSINVLANLPVDELNVENNKFTGWIPNELKDIKKIKTGGNSWSSGPAPPPPPGVTSHVRHSKAEEAKKSGLSVAAIVGIVLGVLVVLGLLIALFSKRRSPPSSHFLEEDRLSQRRPFAPLSSGQLSNDLDAESRADLREVRSPKASPLIQVKSVGTSSSIRLKHPPSDHPKSFNNNENTNLMNARTSSIHVAPYPLAELQTATGNFATGRLLGEGSIGRVYRAKYGDGKVLAVKKIDSMLFRGQQGTEFAEIVSDITKLDHPNICEVVGYCSEQGQIMLVYEYFRNGSLHEFLHLSDDFSKPLTWNTRVRIALGTARAIEYLHEVCSPSCVHMSIKSSNILLDAELNPRLSDCGLALLYERRSQELETGYNAPECTEVCADPVKGDVYSFGVVMLELMTGRMPFDSRKPKYEQSLVRWASPQLHDLDALGRMADPALHGLYPPKSLSGFADVIALCVQSEPEFRPPISQVVQALVRLGQMNQRGMDFSTSHRIDDDDYDY
ncbi:protein STRUBBELIG-RECEPTOR FAMILY 5 [Sesamum indicum]|uniref:Protein STRUBBELIG-RECEPTOR FAMILY 5 n=1 Tax=Sesamum indicum TaxID=4182 RepID=A0A6I9SS54_SESIN|nr:protein STRUBBELIG-RECEPTOR FAMILY 5 [Sesamum indicum]